MQQLNIEDFLGDEIPDGWKSACISIHSHWLTENEASNHWMTFVSLSGENDPNWNDYLFAEKSFVQLFQTLHQEYGLSIIKQNINGRELKLEHGTIDESTIRNIREEQFDAFHSEKLNCVVLGNFDFTFPIYIPEGQDWGIIQEIVGDSGLYVLHQP